jgi:glycosyltransferase involved in cell wall biosynthesis
MCHKYIANSDAGRDHYVRHGGPKRKMLVIKNGIDQNRFTGASPAHQYQAQWNLARFDQLIGMVAAFEARKDQLLLIRAMQDIVHHKPRTGLLLIGDGSRRTTLEQLSRAEGLQDHVVFTGSVRAPEHVYPLFDIYVQASSSEEGIANSMLEAMSCSLPVVATDVGGNREVVVHDVTGRVVPAGDQDSLTHTLVELLNDPQRCRKMGQAGLERVRTHFSLESMVQATQHLYEALLGTHMSSAQEGALEGVSGEVQR